jgi:hypothetical protein
MSRQRSFAVREDKIPPFLRVPAGGIGGTRRHLHLAGRARPDPRQAALSSQPGSSTGPACSARSAGEQLIELCGRQRAASRHGRIVQNNDQGDICAGIAAAKGRGSTLGINQDWRPNQTVLYRTSLRSCPQTLYLIGPKLALIKNTVAEIRQVDAG